MPREELEHRDRDDDDGGIGDDEEDELAFGDSVDSPVIVRVVAKEKEKERHTSHGGHQSWNIGAVAVGKRDSSLGFARSRRRRRALEPI